MKKKLLLTLRCSNAGYSTLCTPPRCSVSHWNVPEWPGPTAKWKFWVLFSSVKFFAGWRIPQSHSKHLSAIATYNLTRCISRKYYTNLWRKRRRDGHESKHILFRQVGFSEYPGPVVRYTCRPVSLGIGGSSHINDCSGRVKIYIPISLLLQA